MADERSEACGRCSMTSVIGMTDEDGDGDDRDPFAGERIEVAESELRQASGHVVWFGRLKRRLDEVATSLTYGR